MNDEFLAGLEEKLSEFVESAGNIKDGIADFTENVQTVIEEIQTWAEGMVLDVNSMFDYMFDAPMAVWNAVLELIGVVAITSPEEFSELAWSYVTNDIMEWTLTIGSTLFLTFSLINMLRQTSDLKHGITAERWIEIGISIVLGDYVMLYGTELMSLMFKVAKITTKHFLVEEGLTFAPIDRDIGVTQFMQYFGIIYLVVSLVCSGTMLFVVYRRYLKLYAIVALAPIAWSTIPGGHGISATASAWLKAFLTKCFEIVVIAIFIAIASKMCNAINLGQALGSAKLFDGAVQILQNMLTMVILAGSVCGAEEFMRRTFGL